MLIAPPSGKIAEMRGAGCAGFQQKGAPLIPEGIFFSTKIQRIFIFLLQRANTPSAKPFATKNLATNCEVF